MKRTSVTATEWVNPTTWKPAAFTDLIGEANRVGRVIAHKIQRLKTVNDPVFKQLFYGPPGTGKSSLAKIAAELLAGGNDFNLLRKAGQDVTIDTVREWERDLSMPSLFGGWRIKLVNELDKMPDAAQVRLLEYLDLMPAHHAFIGTSNLSIDGLEERFQTRMQTWKIDFPTTEQIVDFLTRHWPISLTAAKAIAVGSGGNVRAACLDTESELDAQIAADNQLAA